MALVRDLDARLTRWARSQLRSSSIQTVGSQYFPYPQGLYPPKPSLGFKEEPIRDTFSDYAQYAYLNNPVIFALMERRRQVFSQAHFRFQQLRDGVPGRFFGKPELEILDGPGRKDSGQDLMSQAIQHADLSGNAFILRSPTGLSCLRPDWVTLVAGSRRYPEQGGVAIDAEVIGLAYFPGGKYSGADPVVILPNQFAHFKPTPDPTARFKGISWLKPAIREIMADSAATTHKLMFFENGATPSTVVSLDPAITPENFKKWVEIFDENHSGALNAYKTLYLGGGADVEVVGANLRQLDFKVTQGAGETRLAAAAGVPPIIAGFSEGLASATYSNYGQARRALSDITLWDLWGKMSNALESIIPPPDGSRIWVDPSQIPFLQEDRKDAAEVANTQSSAINTYVTAGFTPESAVDAVNSGDVARLKHTGKVSVQLQDPNAKPEPVPPALAAPTEEEPEDEEKAAVAKARSALIEQGVIRPTQADIAEYLGVSDRTVRRWLG